MPETAQEETRDIRARFRSERKASTHSSVLVGGLVGIVGVPLWSVFDYQVAPDHASTFVILRLCATALMVVSWLLLFTPFGHRRPEWLGLGLLIPIQVAIAMMIIQLSSDHAAYALGMSLAIFASALLLIWQVRYTLILIGATGLALAIGWTLTASTVTGSELTTVLFYLLTASAVAVAGQVVRDRAAWREFQTKIELEAEQIRTRELVAELDRLSREDSLTGLANRRAWDETVARECARLRRVGGSGSLAVILCDVDRLKEINDGFGHAMGDVVIRSVAELLRSRTRAADLVARIGGDEFAILAIDSDETEAATLGEDIRRLVDSEQLGGPALGDVSVSVGVAGWDGDDDSAETLMLRSDRRLYSAKARRNVVCAGDPVEPTEGGSSLGDPV